MRPTAEEILSFLSAQNMARPSWKMPFTTSISTHLLLILLLPLFLSFKPRMNLPQMQVLEIRVMGPNLGFASAVGAQSASMGENRAPAAAARRGQSRNAALSASKGASRKALITRRSAGAPALSPQGPLFGKGGRGVTEFTGSDDDIVQTKEPSALSLLRTARGKSLGASGSSGAATGINLAARGPQGRRDVGAGEFPSGSGSGDADSSGDWQGQSIIAGNSSNSSFDQSGSGKNGGGSAGVSAPSRSFFSLTGPISSRRILHIRLPKYPLWAEQAGVQALISVRLTVSPDGHVRPDLVIEKTSGFPQLDQLVMDAIRSMQFAPLNPDSLPMEEDGVATFDFRLKSPDVPPLDE